ncbi:MAG TPA: hypothetical protein EYP18_07375, partial [Desulfobacterales bacterium]|nr:hypothetical protein [Desulfobacterales bacterium]
MCIGIYCIHTKCFCCISSNISYCDKKSGFCSDSYGISLGITKDELGQKAANKWTKILSDKSFDSSSFTMS